MDHLEAWKKGVGSLVPDPKSVLALTERRRLLEVSRAAARFYRRELFRDKKGWGREFLERGGALEVLDSSSRWLVGYAPDGRSRLVDHLRSQGFDHATMRNAGLGVVGADGRLVDRFHDQLMLPARNDRLEIVGFVGIRESRGGVYYTSSPETQIHRRSSSVIGIAEQMDLLSGEASPILVNDALDAWAIERVSRASGGRWVGIPMCNAVLWAEQARILTVRAATDTVIVAVPDAGWAKQAAVVSLPELSAMFRRVQGVHLPRRHSPTSLLLAEGGAQRLHDALLLTRPLTDYGPRSRSNRPRASRLDGCSPAVDDGPAMNL